MPAASNGVRLAHETLDLQHAQLHQGPTSTGLQGSGWTLSAQLMPLSAASREEQVQAACQQHGALLEVRMVRDKFTGAPRGFAFAHFASIADAARAMTALQVCALAAASKWLLVLETFLLAAVQMSSEACHLARLAVCLAAAAAAVAEITPAFTCSADGARTRAGLPYRGPERGVAPQLRQGSPA